MSIQYHVQFCVHCRRCRLRGPRKGLAISFSNDPCLSQHAVEILGDVFHASSTCNWLWARADSGEHSASLYLSAPVLANQEYTFDCSTTRSPGFTAGNADNEITDISCDLPVGWHLPLRVVRDRRSNTL